MAVQKKAGPGKTGVFLEISFKTVSSACHFCNQVLIINKPVLELLLSIDDMGDKIEQVPEVHLLVN
jgi:hypothetical protein